MKELSREKLRDLRSLDSVKIRNRKGICLVEGERSLAEAVRSGNLLYLVISDDRSAGFRTPDALVEWKDISCFTLEAGIFSQVTDVRTGTGILGVASIPSYAKLEKLRDQEDRVSLYYFDGIREPGNVGALIRTAWALGFSGVLIGKGTADPYSAKSVRSSAGGVFHLPVYGSVGKEEVMELTSAGYHLFLADSSGEDYRSVRFAERSILALGNEAAGFSAWMTEMGRTVGIPLAEGVDSLNVVVAGGIIAARMAG